jgi:phosphoribosyl-ATP pyrophosphohydrolase
MVLRCARDTRRAALNNVSVKFNRARPIVALIEFPQDRRILRSMTDSLDRLHAAVLAARHGDPNTSRTTRLLQAGRSKMAKKLAEEAVEVVIDAMAGHTDAVVRESADLIYNLVVLWVEAGVRPEDVWSEMDRRERLLGIAEKLPKRHLGTAPASARRKVVALEARRHRKRH